MRDKDGFIEVHFTIAEVGVAFHRESIISEEDSRVGWGRKTQLSANSAKPWTTHKSERVPSPGPSPAPGSHCPIELCQVMIIQSVLVHFQ